VQGGGHAWPGAAPKRWQEQRGVRVSSLPASELIWKFFATHAKSSATPRP
jgi:poly(3-hydroxybutyrate) depolymerase